MTSPGSKWAKAVSMTGGSMTAARPTGLRRGFVPCAEGAGRKLLVQFSIRDNRDLVTEASCRQGCRQKKGGSNVCWSVICHLATGDLAVVWRRRRQDTIDPACSQVFVLNVCVCVRDAQGVTMRAWARITPLAAWLLDCVFSGLLHPPEFKCWSTANAPRCAQKIPSPMCLHGLLRYCGANPRRCWRNDCRWAESWCYGGRARGFLGWCGKGPPSRFLLQTCAAFASTSNIARPKTGPNEAHGGEFRRPGHHHQKAWQSGVCPDEWGLAIVPAGGPAAKGTWASQMMRMQATCQGCL